MIDPSMATLILVGFLIIWGIVIPVAGVIQRVKEAISYRYMVLVVFLAAAIGVIVNFAGLSDAVRQIVIIAAAILTGLFIVLRSVEKALHNRWIGTQRIEAKFEKGDIKAGVEIDPGKK